MPRGLDTISLADPSPWPKMKKIGYIHSDEAPVFVHCVRSYDELRFIAPPSRHSVILLAGDAAGVPSVILGKAADHLLASGLCYICTWGPDCERVHDIFDERYGGDGTTEPASDFMSTWHSADTFDEAVEFFAMTAWPTDDAIEQLSYLAILVGSIQAEANFMDAVRPYILRA